MGVRGIEQIHFQIIWNRLLAVVEEQAQTLIRTAFSTAVREAGDLSAGVFDTEGRMLAQAVTGTPGHVNSMAASVGKFLRKFPIDRLEQGDVLVTNDPWDGTGHLNDFTVVTPVFQDGEPVALFASTSHIADVGGLGFGPDGRQVFEEGLNIPIGYLFESGEVNETLFEILKANVRDPVTAEGDLYSLTACNRTGSQRLLEMMREFSLRSLSDIARRIFEDSRRAMEKEIAKLPNGCYRSNMIIDGYDRAVDLCCALTILDQEIHVDFVGTSGTSSFGVNVPLAYTQAYASFGVRCLVGNTIPNNAGSLSVVEVTAPEGSILNALPPCPVSARHAVGQMLPDVVFGCLEQAIGECVPAEGASVIWIPVLMGGKGSPADDGQDDSEPFVMNLFYNGGTGARPGKDGLSTTAFPSGVRNTPTEINETVAPIIVWQKEYRPDSGGAGRYRGGLGQVIEIGHLRDAPFVISKMFDRMDNPARGRQGGRAGQRGGVEIRGGASLPGKGRDTVERGKRIVMLTPGGGGFGDPAGRPSESIEQDLKNGLVTMEGVRRDYGKEPDS